MNNHTNKQFTPEELVFIAERKRYRTIGIVTIALGLLSLVLFALSSTA